MFWGCEMVNGVEADLDAMVVIIYRLAQAFLTCGVEGNTRGRDMYGLSAQRTDRNSLNDVSRRQ